MKDVALVSILLLLALPFVPSRSTTTADEPMLFGFSSESSRAERQWEEKFKAIPNPQLMRDYMQRLSARPHNVGTAYDKDNAEWLLARFKEWGWDAEIETFSVLFPTPTERVLELLEPTRFTARLEEPAVTVDPSSRSARATTPTHVPAKSSSPSA